MTCNCFILLMQWWIWPNHFLHYPCLANNWVTSPLRWCGGNEELFYVKVTGLEHTSYLHWAFQRSLHGSDKVNDSSVLPSGPPVSLSSPPDELSPTPQQRASLLSLLQSCSPGSSKSSLPLPGGILPFDQLPRIEPIDPRMHYSCPVCCKEFNNKKDFRRHYMVHTGEKPFPCPHCPYSARQYSSLKSHLFFRHKEKAGADYPRWTCYYHNFK